MGTNTVLQILQAILATADEDQGSLFYRTDAERFADIKKQAGKAIRIMTTDGN